MKQDDENSTKAQPTDLDAPLAMPSHRLDADQYSADDMDGVSESVFGSGNMAYASLQASQTDAILHDNSFSYSGDDAVAEQATSNNTPSGNDVPTSNTASQTATKNNTEFTDTDRGIDNATTAQGSNFGTEGGNFTSSTVGSLGASQLSSDNGAFAPSGSGLSLSEGLSGRDGVEGVSGNDGKPADIPEIPDVTDGVDGVDGVNVGGGDTIINVDLGDTNIDLGDVTQFLETTIIELGDTLTTLTTSITDVTHILGDVLTDITQNFGGDTIITNITNITENLTENITTTVTEITNIFENVTNIVDSIQDLILSIDVSALNTIDFGVDVPLWHIQDTNFDLDINLTPTYDVVNNIGDLTGIEVISETLSELSVVVDAAQNTINQVTDVVSELNLTDIDASIDQVLDIVGNLDETLTEITESVGEAVGGVLGNLGLEDVADPVDDVVDGVADTIGSLLGNGAGNGDDTDIAAEVGDVAVVDAVIDPVEDLIGDVDIGLNSGLEILGDTDSDADGTDSDITLTPDLDLVDNDIVDGGAEVNLDPVEEIVGDIDLDIAAAGDILDDAADGVIDNADGGSGDDNILSQVGDALGDVAEDVVDVADLDIELDIDVAIDLLDSNVSDIFQNNTDNTDNADGGGNWTESTITDGGGLFDDLANATDGLGDALPDPAGTVAEGIGVLDVEPELDVGSIGGLFG